MDRQEMIEYIEKKQCYPYKNNLLSLLRNEDVEKKEIIIDERVGEKKIGKDGKIKQRTNYYVRYKDQEEKKRR